MGLAIRGKSAMIHDDCRRRADVTERIYESICNEFQIEALRRKFIHFLTLRLFKTEIKERKKKKKKKKLEIFYINKNKSKKNKYILYSLKTRTIWRHLG